MPKLRKHAQLNSVDLPESKQEDECTSISEDQCSKDKQKYRFPVEMTKMKYKDRINLLQQSVIKQKETDGEDNQYESSQSASSQAKVKNFLNKYTDDDTSWQKQSSLLAIKLKSKREIKVKNKMFADCSFQDGEIPQIQPENQQLQVDKRQDKDVQHLMDKVNLKANKFKKRLEFKDCQQDHRFKLNIKDKLKSIQEAQEVKLVVEVPKVMAGKKSHLDGALFLKNVKEQDQQQLANSTFEQQIEQTSIPKDRRTYYEQLGKKLKLQRAESITQSVLKECFKTSYLDENDYIDLLENYKDCTTNNAMNQQKEKEQQIQNIIQSKEKSVNLEKGSKQGETYQQHFEQNKQNQANDDNSQQTMQIIPNPGNKKQRPTKPKKTSKKMNNFNVKRLIEQQAQDSDEQGVLKKDEEQEQNSDDDRDLSSLIDNDVTITEEDQINAYRKFIQVSQEDEERKYNEMMKKMEKRYIQEEERIRKRMEEAAKRNQEKDKPKLEKRISEPASPASAVMDIIANQQREERENQHQYTQNMRKIKQIEKQFGIRTKQQKNSRIQQTSSLYRLSLIQNTQNSLISGKTYRPVRNGMKSILYIKPKSKSNNQKTKK